MNTNNFLTNANFDIAIGDVALAGVREADFDVLYRMETSEVFQKMCVINHNPPKSVEEYIIRYNKFISKRRKLQFIIKNKKNEIIGTIYTIDFNLVHKHSHFCVYIENSARNTIYSSRSIFLFLRFLFENYGFYKIYTDIFEFNLISIKVTQNSGFKEEGYYPEHFEDKKGNRFGVYKFAYYKSFLLENPKMFKLDKDIIITNY